MDATQANCCPRCGGTSGHEHTLTEAHKMGGSWGGDVSAGDSGLNVHRSLVVCLDCGAGFRFESLVRKGLIAS